MWWKWLPWKFIVRRVARAHGFMDPVSVLSHLHRFAQPSEVAAPVELLRAGMVFHARGLMNTKAIQHNLDWVWPYWIERQFNPEDPSFVPRAFSISHINLTHRNWTAVGIPNCKRLPIVDPRGLVTPFFDGWSLDVWIQSDDGSWHLPSKAENLEQRLVLEPDTVRIDTMFEEHGLRLAWQTEVILRDETPVCRIRCSGRADRKSWLIITARPYNPEGVSFIHNLRLLDDRRRWKINGRACVNFSEEVESHSISTYHDGDVRLSLHPERDITALKDDVGMLTAAACFRLEPNREREVTTTVDLTADHQDGALYPSGNGAERWQDGMRGLCALQIPDPWFQFLFDAHLRSLLLHSPSHVYAGPYTYKRFWFRDAAFILHAMLCAGMHERCSHLLDRYPTKQTSRGYFLSQEGEWDSNGEALWILQRYCEITGNVPKRAWRSPILKAGQWIQRKTLSEDSDKLHAGLLPAGFSAEHLGTNDYYYWDDFWGVAGLRSAASLAGEWGDASAAASFHNAADQLMRAVERSLARSFAGRERLGMPASPYRRMDAGAIGSIVVGYPLQLWDARDQRLLETADFLIEHCFYNGGFFQDMIHSGINAYLTLHVAQVLLRAGDARFFDMVQTIARCASPTGQWPEAIHPHTGGGCMGDGQHIWAAAEWILMMRALFVREEGNSLVLAPGIPAEWLDSGEELSLGPTGTRFGDVSVQVKKARDGASLSWQGHWHHPPEKIDIRLPGHQHTQNAPQETGGVHLSRL